MAIVSIKNREALEAAKEINAELEHLLAKRRRLETWAEREQRLAGGRSSPNGWPVMRVDDGITIPPKPYKLDRNRPLNIRYMALCGTIGESW